MSVEISADENRKAANILRKTLSDHFRALEIRSIINKASSIINFRPETITNTASFISTLVADLDPYAGESSSVKPFIMDEINFDNLDSIVEVFQRVDEEASGDSIMLSGWQDVNRSLAGGFRRGLTYLVSAQQHGYKSSLVSDFFRQIPTYNKPYLFDESKKPLILHISAENTTEQNISFLYERIHENNDTSFKITADYLASLSSEEKARYVKAKMEVNGFHIRMLKIIPHETTYRDIFNIVLDLEAEGFEIAVCIIDYLCMIDTTGCTTSGSYGGAEFKDLFKRARNFFNARRTTFITPHQMSPDAIMLVRDGADDLVKRVVGGGYYAGSKQIQQEVDCEIFVHIVRVGDDAYLTYQRGKLRVNEIVPESRKYTCYKFQPIGGILDDVLGNNMGLPRPGATIDQNGNVKDAWW